MDDEKIKYRIGANIAAYRKHSGLTQAGLAEKLNYSDKAVSKWERGESIPDVLTLMAMSELFGITVDELIADPNLLPGNPCSLEKAMTQVSEKALKRTANKNVILALSSTLVWFIALLVFVIFSSIAVLERYSWLMFCYCIPVNAIVLLSLCSVWRDFRWNKLLVSLIVWGCLLCVYATLWLTLDIHLHKIFLLGIPGQISVFLWFRMFRTQPEGELSNG